MAHIQTQSEWETQMSLKVLQFIHDELYVELRFLGLALSALEPKENAAVRSFATDGVSLYYNPVRLLQVFQENSRFLSRAYLHSVFHCIFSHLWLCGGRKRDIWDTACDIVVEYTIDSLDKPVTKRILTWLRRQVYGRLEEMQGVSAAVIYRGLSELPELKLRELQAEFYTDDHSWWPGEDGRESAFQQAAKAAWDKISRQASIRQQQSGQDAAKAGKLLELQLKARKSRRSYQEFLKKFSRLKEEMHCDPDAFDLGYYTYGLSLYKNMPLIEPLETKEVQKIREFIIVLDTSDSTSGKLIRGFLTETFHILQQQESFFHTCKIRILQCDNEVRMDQEICLSQAARFLSRFEIVGGGGTDFRPAFAYVGRLMEQGKIAKPDGLLYFTDGKGIYPKKMPVYRTAFLFLDEYEETAVPAWAMHLKLEPEEFTGQGGYEY